MTTLSPVSYYFYKRRLFMVGPYTRKLFMYFHSQHRTCRFYVLVSAISGKPNTHGKRVREAGYAGLKGWSSSHGFALVAALATIDFCPCSASPVQDKDCQIWIMLQNTIYCLNPQTSYCSYFCHSWCRQKNLKKVCLTAHLHRSFKVL